MPNDRLNKLEAELRRAGRVDTADDLATLVASSAGLVEAEPTDLTIEKAGVAMLLVSRQFERDVRFYDLTDDEIRQLAVAALKSISNIAKATPHAG